MKRSLLLAIFGFATLGALTVPAAHGTRPARVADEGEPPPALPSTFGDAASQVRGLRGLALRDGLDAVASSSEMWTGYAGLMRSAADLPQAQQGIEDFMRTGAVQLLAIPGVPQHVLGRAYAATAAVGEIAAISSPRLPAAGEIAEAIKRAATAFDSLPQRFDERLNDAAVPVAIRRMERKALRGMVAIMLVGTLDVETDSDLRAELLAIYAEGMESLVYFVALDLDDEHTPAVDNIIKGLRLAPLDRTTLRERAALLERAHAALDSSADHLDGERLQLPPDPGFRAPPNS